MNRYDIAGHLWAWWVHLCAARGWFAATEDQA